MAKGKPSADDSMMARLKDQTGKTLEQWLRLLTTENLEKHGEIVKWLKSEHGSGHGYANLIAHKFLEQRGGGPTGEDDLVAAQFAGPKATLRPIYDTLIGEVKKFGNDVELAPKKTYVSLRRSKQFGLIQPSTATRLDVGIKLPGVEPAERLESSGNFNAMVTHRVRVSTQEDVDAELIAWLRKAYEVA